MRESQGGNPIGKALVFSDFIKDIISTLFFSSGQAYYLRCVLFILPSKLFFSFIVQHLRVFTLFCFFIQVVSNHRKYIALDFILIFMMEYSKKNSKNQIVKLSKPNCIMGCLVLLWPESVSYCVSVMAAPILLLVWHRLLEGKKIQKLKIKI